MTWRVFYTPHTDDESIAMAGAIARAVRFGDDVMVVLVTDNKPSARGIRLFPRDDLAEQRRVEWRAAMRELGVSKLEEWNIDEGWVITRPFEFLAEVERRMAVVQFDLCPVGHATTWGLLDIHADSGHGSLSHGLCANALSRLVMRSPVPSALLYGVYIYSLPKDQRCAPLIEILTDGEHTAKRRALMQYTASDAAIGYGYASVPELINSALDDPCEYIIDLNRGLV